MFDWIFLDYLNMAGPFEMSWSGNVEERSADETANIKIC